MTNTVSEIFSTKIICETCEHGNVCAFKSKFKELYLDKVDKNYPEIFSVTISCKEYKQKY